MKVTLVSMPFGMVFSPSIALGLLRQIAVRRGWDTGVYYFNLEFAALIGDQFYNDLAARLPTHSLVGEWVFASCFPSYDSTTDSEFVEQIVKPLFEGDHKTLLAKEASPDEFQSKFFNARRLAPQFVKDCAKVIARECPDVIGITSVFQQHAASIALAREVRELCPSSVILMGGANCEGKMGIALKSIAPWIDVVVSGEGERKFEEILELEEQTSSDISLDYREKTRVLYSSSESSQVFLNDSDLDALPIPDYSDYFRSADRLGLRDSFFRVELPFETSRGCWWGEKHHCTFCGLNGLGMGYRSKSPDRAFFELKQLVHQYPDCRIAVTDNILNMKYLQTLLPRLAKEDLNIEAFWEVKANLTRDQLQIIRDAGVTHIQPGIESFSDAVLRNMKKGVRAIQNIQLLADCASVSLTPGWNILWGFPGETSDDYMQMAEFLPLLFHLQPPVGAGPVGIHRFSPMFENSKELGVGKKVPTPAYKYVFPWAQDVIDDFAYFFDGEYASSKEVKAYTSEISRIVSNWKAQHSKSILVSIDKETALILVDSRSCRRKSVILLNGDQRDFYLSLARPKTREALFSGLEDKKVTQLHSYLIEFLRLRIVVEVGGMIMTIAVPLSNSYPKNAEGAAAMVAAIRGAAQHEDEGSTLLLVQ